MLYIHCMTQIATITDQRQLTLPVTLFYSKMFTAGEKVVVETLDDGIKVMPALSLVQKLKGSIPIPSHMKGQDVDKLISESKEEYFSHKS